MIPADLSKSQKASTFHHIASWHATCTTLASPRCWTGTDVTNLNEIVDMVNEPERRKLFAGSGPGLAEWTDMIAWEVLIKTFL